MVHQASDIEGNSFGIGRRTDPRMSLTVTLFFVVTLPVWYSTDGSTISPTTTPTISATTSATSTTGGRCGRAFLEGQNDDNTRDKLSTLEGVFQPPEGSDYRRRLDFIFIVDRSQSIGAAQFDVSKKLIEQLLEQLAKLHYIFIHNDFTRVAVISFAETITVEINGISGGDLAVDACTVTESIRNIHVNKTFTNDTKLANAMRRATELFDLSKQEEGRSDVDQILWMFYDGECTPAPTCQDPLGVEASNMRTAQVQIFTAGVGEWITSEKRENYIRTLATDKSHYACALTWMDIVKNMTGKAIEETAPLFSEIPTVDRNKCDTCQEGYECACDTIRGEYSCTNQTVGITSPTTTPTPRTVVVTEETPAWLEPVAYGASVGGFILLLILLIALPVLAAKRKRARREEERFLKEEQPIYDGPPLRPPPVLRPPRPPRPIRPNQTDEEALYLNTIELSTLKEGPDNNGYEDGIDDSNEYSAIPYPQDYVNVEDMEQGMDEWAGHLALTKVSNKLNHLAVRSLAMDRHAHTANSPVTKKDFREMENLMRGARRPEQKLKIGDKSYEVDKDSLTNNQIHASRFVHRGLREMVHVSKVYDYVIVGMANDSEDENCVRAVYEIHNYLKELMEQGGRHNIRASVVLEEDIYSLHLPSRYSQAPRYGNSN